MRKDRVMRSSVLWKDLEIKTTYILVSYCHPGLCYTLPECLGIYICQILKWRQGIK